MPCNVRCWNKIYPKAGLCPVWILLIQLLTQLTTGFLHQVLPGSPNGLISSLCHNGISYGGFTLQHFLIAPFSSPGHKKIAMIVKKNPKWPHLLNYSVLSTIYWALCRTYQSWFLHRLMYQLGNSDEKWIWLPGCLATALGAWARTALWGVIQLSLFSRYSLSTSLDFSLKL